MAARGEPRCSLTDGDQISEDVAGFNRRKLMSIAQQDKSAAVAQGSNEPFHEGQINHRAFVDDDNALGQPIIGVMQETSRPLRVAQQPV